MKKKSPYLTPEETTDLVCEKVTPDWQRMALAMADVIDAAWAEMPEDLRELRAEHGCELAGAVRALRMRGGK